METQPVNVEQLTALLGQTFVRATGAEPGSEDMRLLRRDGFGVAFVHDADCCESVRLVDIAGDIADLLDAKIVLAEFVSNRDDPPESTEDHTVECWTWTFVRIGTAKGTVTMRWLGESNGYYGEKPKLWYVLADGTTLNPDYEDEPFVLPELTT